MASRSPIACSRCSASDPGIAARWTTLEILTYLVWLVASVTFILALKFLASPRTARTGNLLGAAGMALIVGWTFFTTEGMFDNWWIVVVGGAIGSVAGWLGAKRVPDDRDAADGRHLQRRRRRRRGARRGRRVPSRQPAPSRRAAAARVHHRDPPRRGHRLGQPHRLDRGLGQAPGRHRLAAGEVPRLADRHRRRSFLALVGIGIYIAAIEPSTPLFLLFVGLSLILGVQLVMPIGGADMPVVVSLLNSYTGIAVAATGFVLSNYALLIAGTLVGASGAILTQLMCRP